MTVMLFYVPHTNEKWSHSLGRILLCHWPQKHLRTMKAYLHGCLLWNRRNTVSYTKKYPRFMPKKLKVLTRLDHVTRPKKLEQRNSAANCNTETSEWYSVLHQVFYFLFYVLKRIRYLDPFWDSKWIGVSTFWGFNVLCCSILIKFP